MQSNFDYIDINLNNIKKITSKNGEDNISFEVGGKKICYHSKYNPSRESDGLLKSIECFEDRLNIFLGFGIGYSLETFFSENETLYPFIVIELSKEIVDSENNIYKEVINHDYNRGFFYLDNQLSVQNLKEVLGEWKHIPFNIIELPVIRKVNRVVVENLFKEISEIKKGAFVHSYGNRVFQEISVNGSYRNYPLMMRHMSFEEGILPFLEGKDVIVVAAGPSLNREIENLRKIKEGKKAFIFSVGSGTIPLINAGILPDGMFLYEAREVSYEHVAEHLVKKGLDVDVPLIYGTVLNQRTLENYKGPKYYFRFHEDAAHEYFNLKDELRVIGGTSIAVATIATLLNAKLKQMYLVGQNLAYLDGQYYAKNIGYDPETYGQKTRKFSIEQELVNGEIGETNSTFIGFRKEIEDSIRIYGNGNVNNLTHNGAKIEGAPYIKMEVALDKIMKNEKIESTFLRMDETVDICNHPIYKKYYDKKIALKESQFKFHKINEKILEKLRDLNRYYERNDEYNMEKNLREFDTLVIKLEKNHYYKYILKLKNRSYLQTMRHATIGIEQLPDIEKKARLILKWYPPYFDELKKYKENIWEEMEKGERNFVEK